MLTNLESRSNLLLATYFYLTKQYNVTKYFCLKFIGFITPIVFCSGRVRNEDAFVATLESNDMQLHEILKYLTAPSINLFGTTRFYSTEIHFEIFKHANEGIVIPPLPYAFLFIIYDINIAYHQYHTQTYLTLTLSYLELMVHDPFYGFWLSDLDTYIVWNLIGICQEYIGNISKAASYYRYAMNIDNNNYNDAANIRLQLLKMEM